jgi:2-oxoglutarate dehydrogenase E2 component (dihydrolipoamide succinyltransferase)
VQRSKQAANSNAQTAPGAEAPAEAAPPPPADPAPAPAAHAAPPAPGLVDRDTLTEAWGDGILKGLPARAKALFSAGRFVSVDDEGAHFALPNVAHRDRCVDMAATVEQKLTAHFGTPVKLVLEVDDASAPATTPSPAAPSSPGAADSPQDEPEAEAIDPAEFAGNGPGSEGDQASEAQARLLEAFPGASEVLG